MDRDVAAIKGLAARYKNLHLAQLALQPVKGLPQVPVQGLLAGSALVRCSQLLLRVSVRQALLFQQSLQVANLALHVAASAYSTAKIAGKE